MIPSTTDEHRPRLAELAPSETRADQPSFIRLLAVTLGLGGVVLGTAAVVANQYGPRVIGEGSGYLFATLGFAVLLYHAVRDADADVRRMYAAAGLGLLLLAVVAAFVPGPVFAAAEGVTKASGYHFLPWTPTLGLLALAFLLAAGRHETDPGYRTLLGYVLLGVGAALAVGSVAFGVARPDTLAGPGLLLALLGLGFLAGYLGQTDTSDGLGFAVAVMVGVLGGLTLAYAFGRAVFPTVLYDGPAALRTPNQRLDWWKVGGRLAVVLAALGLTAYAARSRAWSGWARAGVAIFGVLTAGVFLAGSFSKAVSAAPAPFLVPAGLLLALIGLAYLLASLAAASDNAFVALSRRELAAYFYSPIAYFVLLGMALVAFLGYWNFTDAVFRFDPLTGRTQPVLEPILQRYLPFALIAAFAVVFLVPALTMRLFSEERQTGTLEVLMTAPVNEPAVVLSKFLAAWAFYMLCWLPAGLFLIALRVEGGTPFDTRPLYSYYLAVAATGAGFVAMGLFFSSLTRNQIVAAVMTFAVMLFLLLSIFLRDSVKLGPNVLAVLDRLTFYPLWMQALGGQLAVAGVLVHLSLAAFWLFLTVKVLEARKWA